MKTVKRTATVVAPKEPYYAWAPSLEPDAPIDRMQVGDLSQVYLVDGAEHGEELERLWRRYYASIFESQLYQWWRDEKVWSKQRT
jgi:hypothetical protein